jgi:hypothetical protein
MAMADEEEELKEWEEEELTEEEKYRWGDEE